MAKERSRRENISPPAHLEVYETKIPDMRSLVVMNGETPPLRDPAENLTQGEKLPVINNKGEIGINKQSSECNNDINGITSSSDSVSVSDSNTVNDVENEILPTLGDDAGTGTAAAAVAAAATTPHITNLSPEIINKGKNEINEQCSNDGNDINSLSNDSGNDNAVNNNITNTEVSEVMIASHGNDEMAAAAVMPQDAADATMPQVAADKIEKLVNDTIIIHIKNLNEELVNEIARNKQRDEAMQILFNYLDKKSVK